jgi:O-antigen polymerase
MIGSLKKNSFLLPLIFITLSLVYNKSITPWITFLNFFYFSIPLIIVLTMLIVYAMLSRHPFFITKLDVLVCIYFTYLLVRYLFLSNQTWFNESIVTMLCFLAFYLMVRIVIINNNAVRNYLIGLLIICTGAGIHGIFQYTGFANSNNPYFCLTGTFFNPAPYACLLASVLPVSVYLLFRTGEKKIFPWIYFLLSGTILTLIIISQSRAAWLAALIGSLCVIWYLHQHAIVKSSVWLWVKANKIKILSLTLLLVLATLYFLFSIRPDSALGRILIWKVGFQMFADHPLTGIGYDQFKAQYAYYQAAYFELNQGTEKEKLLAGISYFTFNEYLRILIESGVIGFILFIGILYFSFRYFSISIRQHEISLPVFSSMISILLFSFFSYPFSETPLCLVLFGNLALLTGLTGKGMRISNTIFYKLPLLVAIIILSFATVKLYQQYQLTVQTGNTSAYTCDDSRKAFRVYSFHQYYEQEFGERFLRKCGDEEGLKMLNHTMHYFVTTDLIVFLGDYHRKHGNFSEAEKYYKLAHHTMPSLFIPLTSLFQLYKKTGRIEDAVAIAQKIISKPVKVHNSQIIDMKAEVRRFLQEHSTTTN